MIMSDSLFSRTSVRKRSRLELWRKLHAKWRGSAPQVVAPEAQKYQDPLRCLSLQQLWEARSSRELLGSEVLMEGCVVPEWVNAQALDKLVRQKQTVGHGQQASACKIVGWTQSSTGLCSPCAQVRRRWRCPHGRGAARRLQQMRELAGAALVVASSRRTRQACGQR